MEIPLEVSTALTAPGERAREVLMRDPGVVLSPTVTRQQRAERRFRTSLAVDLAGGSRLVQEVAVEVGIARSSDGRLALPLTWRPIGHERALPAFSGELLLMDEARPAVLRLRGNYDVPFGPLGRIGDGLGGRRLAERSLRRLVEAAGRRLDLEVTRRQQSIAHHPAQYPPDLRDTHRPNR